MSCEGLPPSWEGLGMAGKGRERSELVGQGDRLRSVQVMETGLDGNGTGERRGGKGTGRDAMGAGQDGNGYLVM